MLAIIACRRVADRAVHADATLQNEGAVGRMIRNLMTSLDTNPPGQSFKDH